MKKFQFAVVCLGFCAAALLTSKTARADIQPLAENEMKSVQGAAAHFAACNYKVTGGCPSTCSLPVGGFVFKDQGTTYAICGNSANFFASCPNDDYPNKQVRCAEWTSWTVTNPTKCSTGGSWVRNTTETGCGNTNKVTGAIYSPSGTGPAA